MNILLLNTNPVVSRLVALCMRDDTITFREVSDISDAGDTTYDIIFVDDASYNNETAAFLDTLNTGKIVFFSRRDSGEEVGGSFDRVIKKPFLPSQIQAVIDEVANLQVPDTVSEEVLVDERAETAKENSETSDDEHFIFPLAASAEESDEEVPLMDSGEEETSPKVLDSHEIDQIKALLEESDEEISPLAQEEADYEARKVEVITQKLEEDGLEIVAEEEIIEALSGEASAEAEKKEKKKRKKKKKKQKEDVYTFEEALLAAIENMKPKQIKKLLKNAEVHISIKFKDDM